MQFKLFQMWRVIFSLLALTADPDVWAFPTGAPTSVCDSMFPSHEAGAQGSLSPYELVVNKDTYAGGEEVQVTLKKLVTLGSLKGSLSKPARSTDQQKHTESSLLLILSPKLSTVAVRQTLKMQLLTEAAHLSQV
ncbi:putative defense protein 2 isoform X4 [Branchiostoma floridae x Branchiostoma japonicum]